MDGSNFLILLLFRQLTLISYVVNTIPIDEASLMYFKSKFYRFIISDSNMGGVENQENSR